MSKENDMDVAAQLSSKGQLTVPKVVRDALGLVEGDQVVFRVEGRRAVLARTPSLLDLAGKVAVPAEKRGARWEEVRRRTRAARAKRRA
jgi:AbrB family looped-hinge helix DNA binding protein